MQNAPTQHEVTSRCSPTGALNTWESISTSEPPSIDVLNSASLRRGQITALPNLGLRQPQGKKMTYDHFNNGCVNPQGCVNTEGFTCGGAPSQSSKQIDSLFAFLNAPYLPDGTEYAPPKYVMGLKAGGVNSVTGWEVDSGSGRYRWQQDLSADGSACG